MTKFAATEQEEHRMEAVEFRAVATVVVVVVVVAAAAVDDFVVGNHV